MVCNPAFKLRRASVLAIAVNLAFNPSAFPAPQGAVVVNGQVVISQPGAGVTNIQASNGAIINWDKFSIGAGELARFVQPSASSAVLNRVVGQDVSQLLGQLQSSGRVFLINPNGIVIGAGARIDTNGFIASTLDIADADFLAGKLKFFASGSAGNITNQGLISVAPGGRIALIAPNIENSGIIQAPGGQILLAAGRRIEISSLDFTGVSFEIQAPTDSVLNLGKLLADNGAVQVFAGNLRQSGVIQANRMVQDGDGTIRLSGSNEVVLTSDSVTRADGLAGGAITIQSANGTARVAGEISAQGSAGKGGDLRVLGERVAVESTAHLDASGAGGGGQILVGGGFQGKNPDVQNARRVFVGAGATLVANATVKGDGGRIIVWSDENTRYFASLAARGGPQGGNGGFAEVSGKQNLQFAGAADLGAPLGFNGFLLLDPLDIILSANGGVMPIAADEFADFSNNIVTVSPTGLNAVGGNVILQANRHIYFNTAFAFTGTSLTATANGDSSQNGSVFVNQALSSSGGAINLSAASVAGSGGITTAGGAVNITVANGMSYGGAIATAGGNVTLTATTGSISNANVNAGGGAVSVTGQNGVANGTYDSTGTVTLNAPAGSIYGNTVTAGTANLNASGSVQGTIKASRINAASANSSVQLYNFSGQPLRLGTISGASRAYFYSTAGIEQVAGGLVSAPYVRFSGENAAFALGAQGAPLNVDTARLDLINLAAPAHVAVAGSTLDLLTLQGNLAGLGGSTVTGAANLGPLSLSAGTGVLNVNATSSGGFGSGFELDVSDAAINMASLNMPTATVSLTAGGGGVTMGAATVGSLSVDARGSIAANSVSASTGGISLYSHQCNFSVVCDFNSDITATSLTASAGNISLTNADNGNLSVGALSASGSVNLNVGSLYNIGYYYYSDQHVTANTVSLGSVTSGASFTLSKPGSGDISISGAVNAGGETRVNTGNSYYDRNLGHSVRTASNLSVAGVQAGSSIALTNSGSGDLTFQSLAASGSNRSVTLAAGGSVRTTQNNAGSDIVATGDVSITADGAIGDGSFAHPLDIVAGANSSVSLLAGTHVGTVDAPVTVDTNGRVKVVAGNGQFHVAVQDTSGTAKAVSSIDLSASAAGMGDGGTSTFSAQNLSVNASSDGSTISIGDVVPTTATPFNLFRFTANGSGLTFGNVDLATTGYNQFEAIASGPLTGTANINAGNIKLDAGAGAIRVGNVTSSSDAGNKIDISGGDITAGNLTGQAIAVNGADVLLGKVTSSGTHLYNYVYIPRLGRAEGLVDELVVNASGNLVTTGDIISATSALLSAGSNLSVAEGSGTLTSGNLLAGGNLSVSASTALNALAIQSTGGSVGLYAPTLNTGSVKAAGDATLTGTTFNTGDLQAGATLNLTATAAYQPAHSNLSAGNLVLTAQNGNIDLTGSTVTAPTASLDATGSILGNLTNTSNLTLKTGGAFAITSTVDFKNVSVTAYGDLLGNSSIASALQSPQAFSYSADGTTLALAYGSPVGVTLSYFERSPTVAAINLSATLPAGSNLTVRGLDARLSATAVTLASGSVDLRTSGDIDLTSLVTGSGNITAQSYSGNINVEQVKTNGSSVNLTADAGSILKAGTQTYQIDNADGQVSVSAAMGSVGANNSALQINGAAGLAVKGLNDIFVDVAGTALSNLEITTNASGNGAIAINNSNYGGFALTRGGAAGAQYLALGPLTPGATRNFALRAQDGSIRVMGDISVKNLLLDASLENANPSGDVVIQAAGGSRSIQAAGAVTIRAGQDLIIAAGQGSNESVTMDSGAALLLTAGRDLLLAANGGAAVVNQTATNFATSLQAGGNIKITGGSSGIAGAKAALNSAGSQSLSAGGDLILQGGSATGAAAWMGASTGQEIDAGGNVTLTAGAADGAYARLATTSGTQTVGNDNEQIKLITLTGGNGVGANAGFFSGGSQSVYSAAGINITGGTGDQAGAGMVAAGTQLVRTSGDLSLNGGSAPSSLSLSGSNETLIETTGSSQTIDVGGNLALSGGGVGSFTRIKQAAVEGSQSITSGASLTIRNVTANAEETGIAATGGANTQTVVANGAVVLDNQGGRSVYLQSEGAQSLTASSLEIRVSSAVADAKAVVSATAAQDILLNGNATQEVVLSGSRTLDGVQSVSSRLGSAFLKILNLSSATGSLAQVSAGGDQKVKMDYTSAGALQVGDVTGQGATSLSAGGNQELVVGSLLVQGGATVNSDAKVAAAAIMDISTLVGAVEVRGGAQGSAEIDPPTINLVSNGPVVVQGGSGAQAYALISGGDVTLAATNGDVALIGGSVSGAFADILAAGNLNIYGSGNLAFTPNAGGASATSPAPLGNNVVLGGACLGCTAGLVGNYSISVGVVPTVPVSDPVPGQVLSLLDGLQNLYGILVLTESGEIMVDPTRRRLPQCN